MYERLIIVGVISVALLSVIVRAQAESTVTETAEKMEAGQIIPDVIDAIGNTEFEVSFDDRT